MKKTLEKTIEKTISYLAILVLILLCLFSLSYILFNHYSKNIEKFLSNNIKLFTSKPSNINTETKPLLDNYKLTNQNKLSNIDSKSLSSYKPMTSMSSYSQITNNYENWSSPNNGECSPTEFCGSIYENINTNNNQLLNETQFNINKYSNINFSNRKVNLYNI